MMTRISRVLIAEHNNNYYYYSFIAYCSNKSNWI